MRLPPGTRRLSTAREIDAVSSPLRQEILEHLGHAGQASVTDLGRLMGRRSTVLHYHVNLLRRAGIIRESGRRRAGKRTEALYRLAARQFAVAQRAHADPEDTGAARTIGATLRLAERDAIRAMKAPGIVPTGPGRNLHVRRYRAPLTAASMATVNRLLDQIEAVFAGEVRARTRGPLPAGNAQVVAVTLVLSPAGRTGHTPPAESP